MNYRRILNKNNIGIIFLFMIILLWPVIPHLCDFLVIINIFISFFYGGIKKDNKLIFFIFIILLISFLSFELNNIIYAIRWGVYLINCYLTLTNLDEKTVYKIMYLLQFLTLPVGLIYVKYLGSIDNYNLHLLGDMMFSGSKNHYSYYIIINYIILYYLSQRLDKKKIFYNHTYYFTISYG